MHKVNRKKRNEVNLKNVKNFLHSLFMSHSPSFLSKQNNMIYLLLEKGVTKCEKYNLYKESTRNYSTAIIIINWRVRRRKKNHLIQTYNIFRNDINRFNIKH